MSAAVNNHAAAATQAGGAGAAQVAGNGGVSQMFMTLLVAQIRNQDPLAPMESKDFINQFSSMSQVESMEALASMSSASAALQESMLVVSLGGQVGNRMMVKTDSVTLGADRIDGGFTLESATAEATMVLRGADGVEHRVALGARQAGAVDFSIDPQQLGLPPGRYAIRIESAGGGKPQPEILGTLQGVRLDAKGRIALDVSGVGEVGTDGISRFLGRSGGSSSSFQGA